MENTAVLDRMAVCGTVIINSNVETFSKVTGEALALGKPVIATRCGGPEAFIPRRKRRSHSPRMTMRQLAAAAHAGCRSQAR
jgi:hypothetical protein